MRVAGLELRVLLSLDSSVGYEAVFLIREGGAIGEGGDVVWCWYCYCSSRGR